MSESKYLGMLTAVWIAPYSPDGFNLLAGGILLVIGLYYAVKGK